MPTDTDSSTSNTLSAALGMTMTAKAEPDLIVLLEQEAEAGGLTANELSRRIGIDQALWSRVRRGVDGERFGADACARVVRAFPHLRSAAVRYLSDGKLPALDALHLLEEAARAARAEPPPD